MERKMIVQMVEEACPFAKRTHMRLRESERADGMITLIMEDDPANLNAFGLIHAGAISGLVETVGGMSIMQHLDPMEILVLNSVLNIQYLHPAHGELTCEARTTEDEARVLMEEFKESGRADKAMDLKVMDSSGTMVAQAQATFRLMSTPDEYKKYFGA